MKAQDPKPFDKGLAGLKPPIIPPKCTGVLNYEWTEQGEVARVSGLLFTQDAANCMVKKYDWCIQAWKIDIDTRQKRSDATRTLMVDTLKLDLKRCGKLREKCLQALDRENQWYKNPWFIASMGFVAGALVATGVTVYALRR